MTAAYNALRLQFLLRKRRNAGTPGTAREKHCRMRRPGGTARHCTYRQLPRQADGRENRDANMGSQAALP